MKELKRDIKGYYDTPIGRVASVTTILSILNKPAILNWSIKKTVEFIEEHWKEIKNCQSKAEIKRILDIAKEEAEKEKLKAADLGTRVHKLIKRKVEGKKVLIDSLEEEEKNPFRAFLRWAEKSKFEAIEMEKVIYSKKGYAGTLDLLCRIGKKIYVVDFKVSGGIYPEYLMQVLAYEQAYREMKGGKKKNEAAILRLDKNKDSYEFYNEINERERYIRAFNYLVQYFNTIKK